MNTILGTRGARVIRRAVKPPFQRTIVIASPEQALAKASTVLTLQQQHQSLMLFEKQGRP